MGDLLYNQIYNNLNQKSDDELLEIWQKNNRYEWTDTTFEAIQQILTERGEEVPPQGPAILEPERNDEADFIEDDLSEEDEESQTEFYKPVDVLLLIDWLGWAGKTAILIGVLNSLAVNYPYIIAELEQFTPSSAANLITITIRVGASAFYGFVTYLTLRAIAYILKVLMEFEFNSRGVK
jgi:hypothetical protein